LGEEIRGRKEQERDEIRICGAVKRFDLICNIFAWSLTYED